MPHPTHLPTGAPPRHAGSLARQTLVVALLLVAFFGASIALLYWLTARESTAASPVPAPERRRYAAAPDAAAPERSTAPRPLPAPAAPDARPKQTLVAWPPLPSPSAPSLAPVASSIEIAFKMDPRLTRGLHMGDRWISPPTYSSAAHRGSEVTIEARARARDSAGKAMRDAAPVWTAADPEMVGIAPGDRGAVRLTVRRAGRSEVTVECDGVARSLLVAAALERGSWRVDIAQR